MHRRPLKFFIEQPGTLLLGATILILALVPICRRHQRLVPIVLEILIPQISLLYLANGTLHLLIRLHYLFKLQLHQLLLSLLTALPVSEAVVAESAALGAVAVVAEEG